MAAGSLCSPARRPCSSMSYFEDRTYSGAEFLLKKSLSSAQNPENKGSGFFLAL
jgi:hypothetical protein